MRYVAIIPARYASTRFPGKPLAMLAGKPVIQHVYEHVAQALSDVLVATDDARIYDAVEAFGGKAAMTRTDHRCGTDRCLEALDKWLAGQSAIQPSLAESDIVVVNIQGDEPFVAPEQVRALCACFDCPDTDIATLARPYATTDTWDDLATPNSPKVVIDRTMRALLFSRNIIPHLRGIPEQEWLARHTFYRHVGMYAYRAHVLRNIAALAPTPLEQAESLEQLRWIENGYTIRVAITSHATIGIDTPEDLRKANSHFQELRP